MQHTHGKRPPLVGLSTLDPATPFAHWTVRLAAPCPNTRAEHTTAVAYAKDAVDHQLLMLPCQACTQLEARGTGSSAQTPDLAPHRTQRELVGPNSMCGTRRACHAMHNRIVGLYPLHTST